jgi:hypothetical protein
MRKVWTNVLAPALLFVAALAVSAQESKTKPDPVKPDAPPAKDKEAPAKSKLEQMLELALKNNPDLRVAEAKAREADAEVSRTRLAVTQKVVLLYNGIEAARANVQLAEKQLERLRRLAAQGLGVDQVATDEGEVKLRQAKADLAKLEAEVPYLLGQPNAKVRGDGKDWELFLGKAEPGEDHRAAVESALRYLQYTTGRDDSATALAVLAMQKALAPPVSAPMSEKLREKLDLTVTFKHDGPLTPKDALEVLADRYDLPIVVKSPDARFAEGDLPVVLKDVPLGAVFQWMEDSLPKHCFVVRDYGLVFMQRDKVPPRALLLHDFGKAKEKETTKPKEEKK